MTSYDAPLPSRPSSFRGRITAAILLTAIAVLFVGCMLFMTEQFKLEQEATHRVERHLANLVAAASAEPVSAGDRAETARRLAPFRVLGPLRRIEVRDAHGALVASYSKVVASKRPSLVASTPIVSGARDVGVVEVWIASPDPVQNVAKFLAMGGALFFAATALALFLGRWLAGRISEPVARLSAAMDEVRRDGDFVRRVEPGGDDELGHLTETFNDLLAALHENDQALRVTLGELTTARDAAQAANVQKSQFLANMSHEIRTPLNGVLAMAQILARGDLGPSQREQVEVIRSSGEALLSILNDILDVSKIEAGKFELEVADFDLEEVVNAVHAGFAAVAERKQLAFTVDFAPGAAGLRHGDPTRLRQILNNLVSNALKFTHEGGVRVVVEPDASGGHDAVHVAVVDTGVGVAREKQSLLFEKFSQIDASTTRQYGGTGLGLAICHDLAGLMGGRVWMESELGQGSTFHLALPLPRVAAAPSRPAEPPVQAEEPVDGEPQEPGPSLRVLAAEDNATNQLVLSTVMDIFGFDLVIVANGREAVEAWEREPFDVVLMDIQMPVMDGIAATRLIRDAEAATGRLRTPIVALSANALVHQVEEYLAAGMDSHVAKPIELAKLHEALEAVLTAQPQTKAA